MSAISFDHVWKRFTVPSLQPRTVRELLGGRRRTDDLGAFWALRDITCEIGTAESVGLIGANGSGKSTILRLIGAITRPTRGRIQVRGAVSALIELGAGFHPDFSGRENVYLYGSLMGLSRERIRGKFDAIIGFAELERFVDSPVKHYSSGMLMRLAFSVAAHVEPEILLVDEVLAVGDEAFQRKCLARVDALRRQGVSIVYVSHALDTVVEVCDRVMWVDRGRLRQVGRPSEVIQAYQASIDVTADVGETPAVRLPVVRPPSATAP
jgi:lipopolysaccharide transport system ATP-binding protein